jgi:predicted RecB family nuclease
MPLHGADHYAEAVISPDVLRSYVYCRYKAYLKLSNQVGVQSAYETALAELRAETKQRAIEKLEAARSPIPSSVTLTHPALCLGHRAIIDGELTVDGISVSVDGLRKVDGRSQLGDFHYEPLLFHEGPGAREPHRVLLSVIAILVSRLQGRIPDRGVIYQGCNAASSTVRMSGRI